MPKTIQFKNLPKVNIVILNWNGLDDTINCLDSLKKLDYSNYQVVVIDNGSENNEGAKLKKQFPDVHVVQNKDNKGYTGGCNQGIEYGQKTKSDYILLLNNDVVVTKDFLKPMVNFYESSEDAGMISPVILYTDKTNVWFAGAKVVAGMIRHNNKGRPAVDADIPKNPFKTGYVPGTALLISTKLIDKIGLLDNRYFAYYEDLDWCYKAEQIGYFPYVIPKSVVYHKKSGSTSEGGHKKFSKIPAYYLARNGILFATNYKGLSRLYCLFIQIFVKYPLNIIILIKPDAWKDHTKGLIDGLVGLRKGFSPKPYRPK